MRIKPEQDCSEQRKSYKKLEPATLPFGDLEIGDLFKAEGDCYRKIPPLMIPDKGERNAFRETTPQWVYFSVEVEVTRYGTTRLKIDRVRARRQAGEEIVTTETPDSEETLSEDEIQRTKSILADLKTKLDERKS